MKRSPNHEKHQHLDKFQEALPWHSRTESRPILVCVLTRMKFTIPFFVLWRSPTELADMVALTIHLATITWEAWPAPKKEKSHLQNPGSLDDRVLRRGHIKLDAKGGQGRLVHMQILQSTPQVASPCSKFMLRLIIALLLCQAARPATPTQQKNMALHAGTVVRSVILMSI